MRPSMMFVTAHLCFSFISFASTLIMIQPRHKNSQFFPRQRTVHSRRTRIAEPYASFSFTYTSSRHGHSPWHTRFTLVTPNFVFETGHIFRLYTGSNQPSPSYQSPSNLPRVESHKLFQWNHFYSCPAHPYRPRLTVTSALEGTFTR